MKVKLFTHTDLDGIGCAILAKLAFKDISIEYCNYDNIDEKVNSFFFNEEVFNYDYVFITDISIKKGLAENIDICMNGSSCLPKILLFDHHQTAEYLNKYDWCKVQIIEHGELTSGTRLFYDYLIAFRYIDVFSESHAEIFRFVETVKQYDTWLWKNKYSDIQPKNWNDLFYIMGRDNFINYIVDKINMDEYFAFSEFDLKLLEYKEREIGEYIDKKSEQIITKEIQGYKAGVVFAEKYHSELGNTLSERNPELDFIVIINPSTSISYRTIKDNINLGKDIASIYGGGGHSKAAGSPISEDMKEKIIDIIFE